MCAESAGHDRKNWTDCLNCMNTSAITAELRIRPVAFGHLGRSNDPPSLTSVLGREINKPCAAWRRFEGNIFRAPGSVVFQDIGMGCLKTSE